MLGWFRRSPRAGSASPLPTRQQRHAEALEVVRSCEQDGRPLVLYLRDFKGGARTVHSQYYEQQPFTIDNKLLEQVYPELGVVFVQSEAEERHWEARPDRELGPRGPSLMLADSQWQGAVARLIDIADIIFVDAPVLSPGTRYELETCLSRGRLHKTVVVLNAPNFMRWKQREHTADEGDELIQLFPRVAWSDDLYQQIADNPLVRDLFVRARRIAGLPREERLRLREAGSDARAFRVDYDGVADTYIRLSAVRSASRRPWHEDPWEDNWERTFWGFHRAVLTLHASLDLGVATARQCAPRLIECYRAMVNLLGENLINEKGMVMRGHYELCRRMSEVAVEWAAIDGDPRRRQVCDDMLREATRRADMLRSRKTLSMGGVPMDIPYGPILKTLYFPHLRDYVRCPREDASRV